MNYSAFSSMKLPEQEAVEQRFRLLGISGELVALLTTQYGCIRALGELTDAMIADARTGDYDTLFARYVERDRLMHELSAVQQKISALRATPGTPGGIADVFAPAIKTVTGGNDMLLSILQSGKERIVERSKEAQLQRFIVEYTR